MSSCHQSNDHCGSNNNSFDWLFWGSGSIIAVFFAVSIFPAAFFPPPVSSFAEAILHLLHRMWWGVALGIFAVGLLSHVPREFIVSVLGRAVA